MKKKLNLISKTTNIRSPKKDGKEKMMNKYQEVLNFLCDHAMEYIEDFDWEERECGDYYPLDKETLNANKSVLQELIDRATPVKPIKDAESKIRYMQTYTCPNCGGGFSGTISNFCYHCGQALDWENENE